MNNAYDRARYARRRTVSGYTGWRGRWGGEFVQIRIQCGFCLSAGLPTEVVTDAISLYEAPALYLLRASSLTPTLHDLPPSSGRQVRALTQSPVWMVTVPDNVPHASLDRCHLTYTFFRCYYLYCTMARERKQGGLLTAALSPQ